MMTAAPGELRFVSKVDRWLVVLITATFLLGPALVLTFAGGRGAGRLAAMGLVVIVSIPPALLVVWLFRRTDYTITRDELIVRSGPMRQTVPLSAIHAVTATRTMLSAPALSLDRLEVKYGSFGSIVISPRDKQGFVKTLRECVPRLVVAGIDLGAGVGRQP